MSRIAKMPIPIPNGVEVKIENAVLFVKGPKGSLEQKLHDLVDMEVGDADDGEGGSGGKVIAVKAKTDEREAVALSGTFRALANNMVMGVHQGFEKKLLLVGVGYRVAIKGKSLDLTLGLSHPCIYNLREGVTAEAPSATELVLKSADKQLIGQVAAEIRALRPPEPYKGKGIRYADEVISLKETKKK